MPGTARVRILSPEDSILRWKPNVAYTSGQQRLSPGGEIVAAVDNHTAGSTYDATHWASTTSVIDGGTL